MTSPVELSIEHAPWMQRAIELADVACRCDAEKEGGPFGAVIVSPDDKTVLGEGFNRVVLDGDPTAHAEIVAIRRATQAQHQQGVAEPWNLGGALLYTSAFPCPMCYTAARWANISRVVFAARPQDLYPDFYDLPYWNEMGQEPHIMECLTNTAIPEKAKAITTKPMCVYWPEFNMAAIDAFNAWRAYKTLHPEVNYQV